LKSSTSSGCFNSPEYTPYANDKINLDFEISDSDDSDTIISPPCSPVNTNINIFNTVDVHQIELDVQRARKCSNNYKKNVKDMRVYCIYCKNLQTNFPRHVERKHSLETKVRSFIFMPEKSKERLRQLELLKNKGNFHYNKTILDKKKVHLWLVDELRLLKKWLTMTIYHVNSVLSFLRKNIIFWHSNKCKFNNESQNNEVAKRKNVQSQCAMLLQGTDYFKQLTAEVFIHMKYFFYS